MIDQNRLRDFGETLQKYKAGKANLERRVVAAENWWKLRNRAEERRMGLSDDPADFKSVSGWLHNVIVSKHADAMDAFPEPVVLPREPGDEREAAMLSAVIPCILEQNRFEQVYDRAQWQKLKTGTAAYRVVWDPGKLGGLGDIAVERVDLLNLFWEPGVDDIQKSRYVFYTQLEDGEALCEQYPQLRGKLRGSAFRPTRFSYDDAVDLSGKYAVVEVYYKKGGVLHYCKYVGDTVLFSTENSTSEKIKDKSEKMRSHAERDDFDPAAEAFHSSLFTSENSTSEKIKDKSEKIRSHAERDDFDPAAEGGAETFHSSLFTFHSGPQGLYAHGRYPFVLDPLFPIEGSPCGYGFVDLCRSTQTAIDLMRTAFVKNALVGATPRYFQRLDGSVNEEEFSDLGRALVHVSGNLGEDSLRQIRLEPMSGTYLGVLQSTIAELRETSGNTETAGGVVHSGVTAASAIAALQEASGKGSRDASRASYLAFAEIVELIIELIRQFYDAPRQFRILGADGAGFVSYSNAGLRPVGEGLAPPVIPPSDEGGAPKGRRERLSLPQSAPLTAPSSEGAMVQTIAPPTPYRLPAFDVKVTAQKRSAYSRLSQNELALQLYRLGLFEPGREQQASECLELMDFDGKDELLRRLDALGKLRARIDALERDKALMLGILEKMRNCHSEEGEARRGNPSLSEKKERIAAAPAEPRNDREPTGVAARRVEQCSALRETAIPGALPDARAATAEAVLP